MIAFWWVTDQVRSHTCNLQHVIGDRTLGTPELSMPSLKKLLCLPSEDTAVAKLDFQSLEAVTLKYRSPEKGYGIRLVDK